MYFEKIRNYLLTAERSCRLDLSLNREFSKRKKALKFYKF